MIRKLRNRHYFILDALIVVLIPFIALSLRVSTPWDTSYLPDLIAYAMLGVIIKLPIFYFFGLYRRYWPFASIDSMVSIIGSVGLASLTITAVFFLLFSLGVLLLPRSIPFIDAMLTLILIGGIRFSARLASHTSHLMQKNGEAYHQVLIAGAGEAGQMVAREILGSEYIHYRMAGFVDDDPAKISMTIHGARVLGPLKSIPEVVKEYHIKEVIIAMPTAPGDVIRRVVEACEVAGVHSRTLPGIYEMLSDQVSISWLREVEINDLLRREPVSIDPTQVQQLLTGKTVLVTGAGGSIGSELCVQIAACRPTHLVALGHGENSLHSLQTRFNLLELKDCPLDIVIADIRDLPRLRTVIARYKPEVVFHTAAHKHVPLMEINPEEAVTNNVVGTRNLVRVAQEFNVERFVLISTDKAVQPVNVMGITKHMAELIVRQAAARTGRPYVSVRFGNVLGSRGSVIPLFKQQIDAGGPVTVTHPEMERYFMTIPEAVQLVLQAAALGEHGEVFVLDMGKRIKIKDLAEDMIELSGFEVGRDIQIQYTGLRPGERLKEHLFSPKEQREPTRHEKIHVARNGMVPSSPDLDREIDLLEELAKAGRQDELHQKLIQLGS